MTNLTATEQRILNNMSRERDPGVFLGNFVQALIGAQAEAGTPVNAGSAWAELTVSGVVVDGETFTVDNPAVSGQDVYEFVTDAAKSKTAPGNIAVDIKASTTASTGTLTIDTQPTPGDTITIGDKTYIFVPVGTANVEGEVSIGANLAGAQAAIVAAINGTDGRHAPHPLVRAGAFSANASTITALWGGTVGDTIATTETFTAATNVFAATTLGSGVDCSADDAISALVAAITASDTQGISAESLSSGDVDFAAKVRGAAGNDIVLSTDMANATFDSAGGHMTTGIDGTVSDGVKIMVDDTALYICVAANTVSGKNWHQISFDAGK